MLASDYLSAYALSRGIASDTAMQYGYALLSFGRFLGRPAVVSDFTDDSLNRWIVSRESASVARATIRSQRGALITLWRAAEDDGLVDTLPRRVRKVKNAFPLPVAWEESQLQSLLLAAPKIPGVFSCGVQRWRLIYSGLLTDYYSGLRCGDLLALRFEQLGSDGSLITTQSKTGHPVLCRLPADCMAAIEATLPPRRERIFPITYDQWWYWIRKLLEWSDMTGQPKWLRRTGATHCEKERPGSAQAFLGHRTPGLAWIHYLDVRQLHHEKPLPPSITGEPPAA